MYKVRGDGPGIHFNVGLSDAEKAELDLISLKALLTAHKRAFSSLYRGVCWTKNKQKWMAQIDLVNSKKILGVFHLEEDAARTYDIAAKETHGR
jgi:hypothetical protein